MALRSLIVICLLIMHSLPAHALDIGEKDKVFFEKKDAKVLIDKNYEIKLKDINPKSFDGNTNHALNFGIYHGRVWIQFDLQSTDSSMRILEFKNTQIDDIELYTFKNGSWVKQGRIGDIHPYRTRKSPHRYLHLSINPNGKYLLKIEGRGDPLNLKMRVFTEKGLTHRDYSRQIISGLYFGILFFILLVNIFIILFFREKRNVFLLGYIVVVMVFQIALVGYGYQLFWGDYPYLQNRMTMWAGAISIILLILFIQTFLDLPQIARKTNKILNGLIVLFIINLLLSISSNSTLLQISHFLTNTLSLFTIVSMVFAAGIAYSKKIESSGFVLISKVAVIISLIIFVLDNFGLFPGLLLADISLEIGIAIEVVFLTLAVISSFRMYKNESMAYLKELALLRIKNNEELKRKTEERTAEIEKQKNQLEYTNREIISSINYAKRIQKVLLPSEKTFLNKFTDGFIFSRPKEIVSGDFYWHTEIKNQLKNGDFEVLNLICMGDSNDQGVPGALLGVLYMRIIQSAVKQNAVKSAGDILSYISKEINLIFPENKAFEKHKLSCSICVFNKEKYTMEFAGAHSSILHISSGEIIETKGNPNYLEGDLSELDFTTQTLQMKPSDSLFIFTDGLEKQLKKNQTKLSLKNILLEHSYLTPAQQKSQFNAKLDQILKDDSQVDDITILALTC